MVALPNAPSMLLVRKRYHDYELARYETVWTPNVGFFQLHFVWHDGRSMQVVWVTMEHVSLFTVTKSKSWPYPKITLLANATWPKPLDYDR